MKIKWNNLDLYSGFYQKELNNGKIKTKDTTFNVRDKEKFL